MKDAEKAAVFTVWGSGEQLLENYLIRFHEAMTSAHKSSNYIEAGSVRAQPRISLGNVDTFQHDSQQQSHHVGPTVLRCTGRDSLKLGFLLSVVFIFI